MKRKKCILHANCQGEPLRDILFLSEEFRKTYEVRIYTNYIREEIPAKTLGECSLFLYQHLGKGWGELSSESLISRLSPDCTRLAVPNMLFTFYWPTWDRSIDFPYPDSLLESLLDRGLEEWEILHLYLKSDLRRMLNLEKAALKAEKWERLKESHTPVKYVDFMFEKFRARKLFNTFNHPGKEMMIHSGCKVLDLLEMEQPPSEALEAFPEPFPEFEMPIHPQVAKYWGLEFCGPETLYNVYGKDMNFEEYVSLYIKCRKMGIDDFISFLRVAAKLDKKPSASDMAD